MRASIARLGLSLAWVFLACSVGLAAEKRFSRDDLQASALRLEARLKAESDPAGRPASQFIRDADVATQRNDFRAASRALQAAVNADPNNIGLLLRLSDTYGRIDPKNDWRERAELRTRVSAAAYLAYRRATSPQDEARALSVLGNALAADSLFRPALDALRISIETRDNADVRDAYEKLLAEHGFRVLDYQVDSDAASPRLCVQFSEKLVPKLDATPYVSMPGGMPGGVVVDDQQLCIDGLKHGERYQLTIRAGLPSVVGEALREPVDYTVYVRDRSPMVRFTGKNYVLPRTGQQGIPIVTINLKEAAISIYRLGDRSIAQTVLGDDFLSTITGDAAKRLGESQGVKVWSGTLATETRLNEEVTTAFPISEAVGETLQPGIYVMVARRADVPEDSDSYSAQATQWFVVSDLGLATALTGDGLTASVRSLASASPVEGVELRLVAHNNEILGTATSDANGVAHFEAGLTRGEGGMAPGVLVAVKGSDYAVLSLAAAAFDLSDRGVTGRSAPGPLDAFVTTERGVYRSGETVQVTALLRNASGVAVPNVPLILTVERPDGVEMRRMLTEDAGFGGRTWSVPLISGAMTGTWHIKAFADPKRPPIGQASFLVEDYVPDRLELTLTPKGDTIARGTPAQVQVSGRWLFGAPAADLALEGEAVVSASAAPPPGLDGYHVGLEDEEVTTTRSNLAEQPHTDRDGHAQLALPLPDLPSTSRPLKVDFTIRLTEASGRGVERKVSFRVAEARPWIGVKPLFGDSIGENETATFDVVLAGPDGKLVSAKGLRWELSRIETRFQWFRSDGRWSYDSVTSARRVANGTLDVAPGQPGRIAAQVQWGRYRLDVTSADGTPVATSVLFDAGTAGTIKADAPDVIEVTVDKASYQPGETAHLRINARTDGQATIQLVGEKLYDTRLVSLHQGANTVDLPVGNDWGPGAYAVVTAVRPLDAAAKRMPGRAMGVRWIGIDRSPHIVGISFDVPDTVRPRQTLNVPIKLAGLAGEEARITVAAVDVGILNLTSFKTPDPAGYFYGQRALGAEFRDLYGYLIDGMQGTRGRIRVGGDTGEPQLEATPPTQAPLALFSGVVKVGPDGVANVSFDLPAFAGTVRLMAVAWTSTKIGSAAKDVVVRDPIVLTGTLPRFLAVGDRSRFLVEIQNVEGPAGDYIVSLDVTGPVVLPAEAVRRTVKLGQGEHTSFAIPVTAAGMGEARFDLAVTGPGNVGSGQTFALRLHPANPIIQRRTLRTLAANNGAIELNGDMLADVIPGTGSVSLSISPIGVLDVPGLYRALDQYPYRCTEQTVSRALPLLYLSLFGSERDFALETPAQDTVNAAIERVLARQSSNGSFGLWGVGGEDIWLDAYVADFLTRAREKGFVVPQAGLDLVLDRLRNTVANQTSSEESSEGNANGLAYALYVLARNGRPVIGDLRYLADAKSDDLGSPLARAQVGAALALLGDRGRAQPVFAKAVEVLADAASDDRNRSDYGSQLRDGAALIALMAEAKGDQRLIQRVTSIVERARSQRRYVSTQEEMWLLLAAQTVKEVADRVTLTVNGEVRKGVFGRSFRAADLATGAVAITNTSAVPVPAVVTITGAPVTPEPPGGKDFTLERTYYRLDGTKVDPRTVRQNDRLLVVLKVTEAEPSFGRVIITDRLPAGFEIDSPALVDSAKITGVPAAENEPTAVFKEFRDDRFVAAYDRAEDQPPVFSVAYIVRAVAPGTYSLPGATLEDMYRPERFARTAAGTVEVTQAQ